MASATPPHAKHSTPAGPIQRVLIANRGEIAVRITKSLQKLGIEAVAVYSDPDVNALHVKLADRALALEGTSSKDTYLNIEKLITVAQQAGVDAIHPGYGFLSENAAFARACEQAGLMFIGPSAQVIEQMGDKLVSKAIMAQAGVPVVPSWQGHVHDLKAVQASVETLGYPVLIKAAAGGGGKGMRLVHAASELEASIAAAQREALHAFGDDRVFIEKYVTSPRHIEFQVFGDHHGQVVHLFERDCSIQRRHQKMIEESPSPVLSDALRAAMGQAAVKAAQAVGYTNAGTVEFIVDASGQFYFLEMNTRLQVEHPVTEQVTGLDLVQWQIQVAQGEPLPLSQDQLTQRGHALECRVYAEDPFQQFLPSTGWLHYYQEPSAPGLRIDSGVEAGGEVTVHYDPMLSKVITTGPTRQAAIDAMQWALSHYPVLGVMTNHALLLAILKHPQFVAGTFDTHFLTQFPPVDLLDQERQTLDTGGMMALGAALTQVASGATLASGTMGDPATAMPTHTPWQSLGGVRL